MSEPEEEGMNRQNLRYTVLRKLEGDTCQVYMSATEQLGTQNRDIIERRLMFGKQYKLVHTDGPIRIFDIPAVPGYNPVTIVTILSDN